jgi:hypothetical protein
MHGLHCSLSKVGIVHSKCNWLIDKTLTSN